MGSRWCIWVDEQENSVYAAFAQKTRFCFQEVIFQMKLFKYQYVRSKVKTEA